MYICAFSTSSLDNEEETGGPVAYTEQFRRTHKRKESGEFVSQRAKEVVESYEQQLIERHGDDSSQHPQFDASAWLVATGQPKKGRVFGFGIGIDAGGVINSTMESGPLENRLTVMQMSKTTRLILQTIKSLVI
ncbi:hypothetical protein Taro_053869 [Colocasia esculenta]|uniref:Uncharacterized protein n=1 Tax=Colocasia esculenta TaxID=4460 RepID=A0A843XNU4_COLES|nr:hypothetical protein [Colocasia esculenta]